MTCPRPPSPKRLASVAWLLLLLLLPRPSVAEERPEQGLAEAIDAFRNGGFAESAAQLDALLYPLKLTRPEDIQAARVYLGLAAYILGRESQARAEFRKVLEADLSYKLDPVYTPPDILAFFDALRREIIAQRPPPSLVPSGPAQIVAPVDALDFVLSTAPLGIAQLRAGRPLHGGLLFSGQVLLVAGTASSYLWLQAQPAPQTDEDFQLQRGVKVTNNVLFWCTAAAFTYGTGDALYRYATKVGTARVRPGTAATPFGLHLAVRF